MGRKKAKEEVIEEITAEEIEQFYQEEDQPEVQDEGENLETIEGEA